MRILLLDNYDSFTYNLYHYLKQFSDDVIVERNDQIVLKDAEEYTHIVISPGPGLPYNAGISMALIKEFWNKKAILGVCLGAQALGEFFNAKLYNQNEVAHGIQRRIRKVSDKSWLLKNLPQEFDVGLYHSWAIDPKGLMSEIELTAMSNKETLMAFEHISLPLAGLQFHPESIMSEHGLKIIENWLSR